MSLAELATRIFNAGKQAGIDLTFWAPKATVVDNFYNILGISQENRQPIDQTYNMLVRLVHHESTKEDEALMIAIVCSMT